MGRFQISTHGRLQDDQDIGPAGGADVRTGAYEPCRVGGGGEKGMSCACHWAVNQAAGDHAGRMWGRCYAILPSGIYPGERIVFLPYTSDSYERSQEWVRERSLFGSGEAAPAPFESVVQV